MRIPQRCKSIRARIALPEEKAQSLMELAVSLPVLLLMLLGGVEFGRLSYAAIEVANAARAGVAYGAQSPATAADLTGMQNAATRDGSGVSMTATASQNCSCSNGAAGVTCANAATTCSARTLMSVQVNTTANFDPLIHIPGMPATYTLNGHATMPVQ